MNRGFAAWSYNRGKPEVEALKRRVTHDELPSIRKAGDDTVETLDVENSSFLARLNRQDDPTAANALLSLT